MTGISFRARLMLCMAFIAVAAFAAPLYYGIVVVQEETLRDESETLLRHMKAISQLVEAKPSEELDTIAPWVRGLGIRLTLIDKDGHVVADTSADVSNMESHADRPEVIMAREKGEGVVLRNSRTLGTEMLYASRLLSDGRTLRLAVKWTGVAEIIASRSKTAITAACIAALIGILLALLLSEGLRRPVHKLAVLVGGISLGNYADRVCQVPGKEFAPLAKAVNRMAERIVHQLETMKDQTAMLTSILETMHDGLLVVDGRGKVILMNRALKALYPPTVRAQGALVAEVVPLPNVQDVVNELIALPAKGTANERHFTVTSKKRTLDVHISTPRFSTPSLGAVAVFRDVTDILHLKNLRQDFVANASHEFRTPLTAILGSAETLSEMLKGSPEQRFCDMITRHATYLKQLTDDLLQLTKLEQDGDETASRVCTNLADCVFEAQSLCAKKLAEKDIRLECSVPDTAFALCSTNHIVRVLTNLIDNASRYAPEGGSIRITGRLVDGFWRIGVEDDGPGIPAGDLPRIFERFFRSERHRGKGQTGLGLAICRHIVELHGGSIAAQSPTASATTEVSFTLPAWDEKPHPGQENQQRP